MKRVLCLVSGHQRTLMPFTSNRFSCRRCGAALGRDVPALPSQAPAMRTHPKPRAADPMRRFRREHPFPDHLAASGMRRPRTGTVMTRPPDSLWSAGDIDAGQGPSLYDADPGRDVAT
jgi:hypothetical protein